MLTCVSCPAQRFIVGLGLIHIHVIHARSITTAKELHEAVTMAGCNPWQRLTQLQLPVAIPHIMLGINQTIMFAFSMVIIAAFIGTIDLGQQIFKALSETAIGKGMVLGLCVSFMALAVDHLVTRWAEERRRLLGLD